MYPNLYRPKTNFALRAAAGDDIDPVKLAVEFADIAEAMNQHREFIRALANPDRTFKPATLTTMTLTEAFTYTATAGQTVFVFPGGFTLDSAVDTASVHVDGLLLAPASVTLADGQVTIPACTAGQTVVVNVFEGAQSVRSDLASTDPDLGASLIGVEDPGARWSASNVEGVLTEIDQDVVALDAALTPILGAVLKDGSIAFEGDQSMGGNKLTDVADGTDPGDAINFGQLSALSDLFTDLDDVFLALAGGTMSGPINMGTNKVTNLGTPTANADGATKKYVDDGVAALAADALAVAGLKTSTARGTLTGPVTLGAAATADADADQTTTPASVAVHTIAGVPRPGADDHASNKKYVDEEITDLETRINAGIDFGGTEQDGTGAAPNLTAGGVWNFTSLTLSGAPLTVTGPLKLFVNGNVTISTAITVSSGRLEIYADGNITVSAAVQANKAVVLKSQGTITVNATITAGTTVVLESDGDMTVSANVSGSKVRCFSSTGDLIISSTVTALNDASTTAGDPEFAGTAGGTKASRGGGGGGGGLGGGAGGVGENTGGAAGAAAATKSGHDIYQWALESGGDGGAGLDAGTGNVGGKGGGIIDLYAKGNINIAGAVIDAGGGAGGGNGSSGTSGGGGGGGGSVRAACEGSITDGTLYADGGAGGDGDIAVAGGDGGSGGGGSVLLIATAFVGTQTIDVTGGAFGNGGAGAAGTSESETLTAAQILTLREQGVFDAIF